MGRNRLRDVFNRIIWTNVKDNYEVVIISRGEPGNVRVIPLSGLIRASRDGIIINLNGNESFIPYHRVLLVRSISGSVIYEKGGKGN